MLNTILALKDKIKFLSLWFYFIAATVAELLTILVQPWVGLACYWILLMYSIAQALINRNSNKRDLLLGLSLVPLIRIISISLPLTKLPQLYWFPLIYFPLLAAAIAVMYVTGLRASEVGLKVGRYLPFQLLVGLAMGFAIGTLEYAILKPVPYAQSFTLEDVWLPALILFITTGFVEEIIFRGVLQRLAEPVMGVSGIIYLSLIFAVLHAGFYSILDVLFIFLISLIFGAVVRKTGSLSGVIIAHGITNVILFTVAPFILG